VRATNPGGGRNREADVHGQTRFNETRASTTDPPDRAKSRAPLHGACVDGELQNGLVAYACFTEANAMLSGSRRYT
jgi:hypothetical protein